MVLFNNVKYEENTKMKDLCNEFINSKRPKYVMGRNEFALSIAENIEIDGYIDDFTHEKSWDGKPIVPLEKIPKNSIISIAVVGIQPLSAVTRVKNCNLSYIDYFSLKRYSNINFKDIPFIKGFDNDYNENCEAYYQIYEKLYDEESKQQFSNLINFRLTYDLSFMKDFKNIQEQQYFEPFITLDPGSVFVDIGGFDGFTTKTFIDKCPNYKSIYFFEPDENNMQKAKELLKKYINIFYYQTCLSNKRETLFFKSSGSSSKIDNNGDIKIQATPLDESVNDYCTYIKMDVEGWESRVLEGCKRIIVQYRPQLAICVYHKCDDLWKIPEQILSIRDDYKIYLRHYTEGITETVMYFI